MTRYVIVPARAVVFHSHACALVRDYLRRSRLPLESLTLPDLRTHNDLQQEYEHCPVCIEEERRQEP